ncbi:sensor histidine kinase [Streptomyces sp. NPDC058220]|uniref:sensor histidine kinase n=1 Tax=Streptomyces sp. NPDC058220 TaxID=3346387 RepID=UPI0036EEED74
MKGHGVVKRLVEVARVVPRTLREDLWTAAADPLPRVGRPRWLDWLPAFVVPLVLCAAFLVVANADQYVGDFGLDVRVALLLAGIQSAAVVVALFRPILAWWATTVVLAVIALSVDADAAVGTVFPWTGGELAVLAWVLFLVALRARPRVAAEVLVISVLTGQVCGALVAGPRVAGPLFSGPLFSGPLFSGRDNGAYLAIAVLAITVVVGASLRGVQVARMKLVVQEEITTEERARRTLLEERNRIARELHDVVAHHMSVISIQAQVAPHLVENPSEELKENLAGIRENAVEALTELRRVLGVLRSEDAMAEGARHAPQPTLGRLDELVGNVRGAGLRVTTEIAGEPHALPPGLDLSAFRIVQEALSNAMRHAPGAEVRVEIGYHASGVTVRVTNTAPDRPAVPSPGAGHGLLGMRERTAMLGGELATGATRDGGYEVTAMLPTKPFAVPDVPAAPAASVEDTP